MSSTSMTGCHYWQASPGTTLVDMIECNGIRFSYAGHEALAGVDLTVQPGEVVALLGTNGAGKTTLVDLIRGMLTPASGTIRVLSRDPRLERRALAPLIGLVPQDSG